MWIYLVGGWTNPFEKYARHIGNLPPIFEVKIKHIWNHHLLIGNPYNGYINPYYWIDEFFPYGNNGSFDPIAQVDLYGQIIIFHQPRFPWNKTISWGVPLLPCHLVRSCEVAKRRLKLNVSRSLRIWLNIFRYLRKNGWRTVSEAPKKLQG